MRRPGFLAAKCSVWLVLLLSSSLMMAAMGTNSGCTYTGKEEICPTASALKACIKKLRLIPYGNAQKIDISSCFRCNGRRSISYIAIQPSSGGQCTKVDEVDEKRKTYLVFDQGKCSQKFCIFVYDKKLRPADPAQSRREGKCGTDKDACNLCVYTNLEVCLPAGSLCGNQTTCTKSSCDASGTCKQKLKTGYEASKACNDGNKCTKDTCDASTKTCKNEKITCPPTGNQCTVNECDSKKGCCTKRNKRDKTPCTYTDKCYVGGQCKSGYCKPGTPKDCSDGNACTIDSCDSKTGCKHAPKNCNDNNACTIDTCNPTTGCKHVPVTIPANTTCVKYICDRKKGVVALKADNGTTCTLDSSKCTINTCQAGVCTAGANKTCDDSNKCTDDTCSPLDGTCVYTNKTIPADTDCVSYTCTPGGGIVATNKTLPADTDCVTYSCNSTGSIVATNKTLPADTDCVAYSCNSTGGIVATNKTLPADTDCVTYSCNSTGSIVATNVADNTTCTLDSSKCTINTCQSGVCTAGANKTCDDSNQCTDDTCSPLDGTCVYTNKTLPADTDCVAYSCTPGGGIVATNKTLPADTDCVTYSCTPGGSIVATNVTDNTTCTLASSKCTINTCQSGVCTAGESKCKDSNPCTDDTCDSTTGTCSYPYSSTGVKCDDGNATTCSDQCDGGGMCLGDASKCSIPKIPLNGPCGGLKGCGICLEPGNNGACGTNGLASCTPYLGFIQSNITANATCTAASDIESMAQDNCDSNYICCGYKNTEGSGPPTYVIPAGGSTDANCAAIAT